MTKQAKIKKGQEFWCLHPRMAEPTKGKVVSLTNNRTKMIGMEFPEKIKGFHDCDGRGQESSCLWVKPRHILTDDEFEELKVARGKAKEHAKRVEAEDIEELDLTAK